MPGVHPVRDFPCGRTRVSADLWKRSLRVAAPSFEQHQQAWVSSRRRDRMLMRSYDVEAVQGVPEGGAHFDAARPSRKSRRPVIGETSSSWQTGAHVIDATHQPEVNQ
jgi:hypothetical protein